jgi:hypothetical protein
VVTNNELKSLWKEAVWSDSRHCPGVFLEGLAKTMKNLRQDSQSLGQELTSESPQSAERVWSSLGRCIRYQVLYMADEHKN